MRLVVLPKLNRRRKNTLEVTTTPSNAMAIYRRAPIRTESQSVQPIPEIMWCRRSGMPFRSPRTILFLYLVFHFAYFRFFITFRSSRSGTCHANEDSIPVEALG
jgi:hypothetical protein